MIRGTLAVLEKTGYFPVIRTADGVDGGGGILVGAERLVQFGSNDYLGLSRDPRVIEAARAALVEWGVGSGGSRLTAGEMHPHRLVERRLADFKGTEDAVVFSTGFLANTGVLPALLSSQARSVISAVSPQDSAMFKDTEVFFDQLVHASIIDGIAMSTSQMFSHEVVSFHRYRHRDTDHLERLLTKSSAANKLIVTDGVFSLHGRVARLDELTEVAAAHGALLYVDDAHGLGVFGANGRGVAESQGVEDGVDFAIGTLSKAVGVAGGYIAGSEDLCRYIRVCARTYMFQTAMPAALATAITTAIDVMEQEPQRRVYVLETSARVRDTLASLGFDTFGSQSQIIPVRFHTHEKAAEATTKLREMGILAPAVWYPAVGRDEALVRINITYLHTDQQVSYMLNAIGQVGRDLGVIGA
jgi:8-amino-7-oxononanoate synthase